MGRRPRAVALLWALHALVGLSCGFAPDTGTSDEGHGSGAPVAAAETSPSVAALAVVERYRSFVALGSPRWGAVADAPPWVGFTATDSGLAARFDPATRERASRPARVVVGQKARDAVEVRDTTSGATVRVALAGATDAPAEVTSGYVVYRAGHTSGADLVERVTPEGAEDFVLFDAAPSESSLVYDVALGANLVGLRLVARTLEFVDADGAPRLRMAPPYIVDTNGRHEVAVAVSGCDVDTNPSAPWGREATTPGATSCSVRVSWGPEIEYPAMLDPAWTTTGSLATARYGHTATVLSDGRVLVAAGSTNTQDLATAELYDAATGTWAATGSLGKARYDHTASALGDERVLVRGNRYPLSDATAELYDPASGTWAFTGSMVLDHTYGAADVLADGRVLVVGGYGKIGFNYLDLATAELFDPVTGTWSTTGSMGTARLRPTLTALADGRALVAGGQANGVPDMQTAELYDPVTQSWSPTNTLTVGRGHSHEATRLADGRVLVLGGQGTATGTADLFDPATGTFSATGNLAIGRTRPRLSALPGGMVLVTGDVLQGELYDPASGTFSLTSSTTDVHYLHSASTLDDGRALVVGGFYNTTLASAELYGGGVKLNELRIDQPGVDNDEYIELTGPSGRSLTGLTLVVIGDGTMSASGDVESAISLAGTIDATGLFVIAESTFSLGTPDLTRAFSLENTDNLTFLLVEGWSGSIGADLDSDDDCDLDSTPWTFVYDRVGVRGPAGIGDCVYSADTVGPEGSAVPMHASRCADSKGTFRIGTATLGVDDTPGAPNTPCGGLGDACSQADDCASEHCVDGVCCSDACGGGSLTDCVACNVGGFEGTCSPRPLGTSCGDATDTACTNPDTCALGGVCLKNHAAAGAPCGDQGVACRLDDGCDGNGQCLDAGFEAQGMPCGDPTDNECTDADVCTGGVCSPNHAAAGTPCGDQGIECHVDDQCDGTGSCTDAGFDAPGTSCGDPTDDECKNADVCSASGSCVANDAPAGAPCGDQGVACHVDDACDGSGACVDAGASSVGTSCGDPTSDACTAPDSCDDAGTCLPNDTMSGATCGDHSIACHVDDACDGAGKCVDNGFLIEGTSCDDATGECDAGGTCVPLGAGGSSGSSGSGVSGSGASGSGTSGSGTSGSGVSGGTGASGGSAATPGPTSEAGGCGCRIGSPAPPDGEAWLTLIVLTAVASRLRHRGKSRAVAPPLD